MRTKRIVTMIALVVFMVASLQGCLVSRLPVDINDHPEKETTRLETLDRYGMLNYTTRVQHQFWVCVESETTLECEPVCGDSKDIGCPAAMYGISSTGTNVR